MKHIVAVSLIILSAVLLRLVPHAPNFAPVGAMALFGGAYIGKKYAVSIVFLTMLISDYVLLYVHPFSVHVLTFSHVYPLTALLHSTTVYVYGSFLVNVGIGMWVKNHKSIQNVALASLASSLLFFLITNFGAWASGMYSRNMFGLWESYLMGLPFLRPTVFGDLFYNGAFFSGYAVLVAFLQKKEAAAA